MNDKKILILGAGRGQRGLYQAAKEMGIKTIAGTLLDNNPPCVDLADEICVMNIVDPDEVVKSTKDLHFDGVVTCCLDKGLKALGRLSDLRGLPGFSEKTAELCNDKYKMKMRFEEYGVNTAPFCKIYDSSELEHAIKNVGGYPVIIKATDLAGSQGIFKAFNLEEALSGFRKSIEKTKKDYVIVEKCLIGKEFGAQAFIQNGRMIFILPHGDILFHGSTDVPIGHYVPFDTEKTMIKEITEQSEKAIRSVGLDNCAVNLDFIEEDGKVYVLELSGRIGANGLPEVVSGYYNINYYKMVILAALGISVDDIWKSREDQSAVLSKMIYSENKSGLLNSLKFTGHSNENILNMEFFIKPGNRVQKFENTTHCLGQFVVKGIDREDCIHQSEDILSNIIIDIDDSV